MKNTAGVAEPIWDSRNSIEPEPLTPFGKAFEVLVTAVNTRHWGTPPVFKTEIDQAAFNLVVASGRQKAAKTIP